jgi:outer membrane protein OmpA-like peptidoglycan-associated protein
MQIYKWIRWMRSRLAVGLFSLCLLVGLSGCWNEPNAMSSAEVGAAAGALVGGTFGCSLAYSFASDHNEGSAFAIGCPVGVVAGAVIGGVVGYAMYGPPPQQWTPPPVAPKTAPPPPPPPPPAPMQEKITLRGVHFDFNKARIRPEDVPILDEAVNILKSNPNVQVNVNAYCDAIGGYAYNLKLSDRRAEAVTAYLEKAGIPSDRLIPHGYGKTHFVASNATAEGRAQNRRVELEPLSQ